MVCLFAAQVRLIRDAGAVRSLGQRLRQESSAREAKLNRLQRAPNAAVNAARDLLLSRDPDRLAVFREACESLRAENDAALSDVMTVTQWKSKIPRYQAAAAVFWSQFVTAAGWPQNAGDLAQRMKSLGSKRNALNSIVKEMGEASQRELEESLAAVEAARESSVQTARMLLALAFVFLSIAIGGTALYTYRMARHKAAQVLEIESAKRDLEALSGRLLTVQEAERKRLSRELHDSIGQTLTALRIEVSRLKVLALDDDGKERLARARLLADQSVHAIRDMSVLLRPTLLDDLGLEPALRWHAEEFSRRTHIPCEFSVRGLGQLPDDWNTCVYRVVQEAIHNCEKHASPTRLLISLLQDKQLAVTIEDDGCGFDAPAVRPGLGILGMRERAYMLGGTLNVESALGRGTKVILRLPLPVMTSASTPCHPVREARLENSL